MRQRKDRFVNAVSSVFGDVLETVSPNTERVYDQILAGLEESAGKTLPTQTRSKDLVAPWRDDAGLHALLKQRDKARKMNPLSQTIRALRWRVRYRARWLRTQFYPERGQSNQSIRGEEVKRLYERASKQNTVTRSVSGGRTPEKLSRSFQAIFQPGSAEARSS